MMAPVPRDESLAKVDDVFSSWAREGRDARMEESHRVTAGRALEAMVVEEGSRFLDLGAGNGWAAREAAKRGAEAVAVDVSMAMLRRAKRDGVEAVRADLSRLPFKDATFDNAWSMEALYYVGPLDAALVETARVLDAGGEARVVVDRYRENAESHGWDEMLGVPMHLLSEAEWKRALERAGFAKVRTERLKDASAGDWRASEGSLLVRAAR